MASLSVPIFVGSTTLMTLGVLVALSCVLGFVWYARNGAGLRARRLEARLRSEMAQGRYGNAVPWLIDNGRYREAAEIEEKRGNVERAAKLYERADDLPAAAQVYMRAADYEMAALVFKQAGLMAQASEAFAKAGRHDAAAAAKGEERAATGRQLEAQGRLEEAADLYVTEGHFAAGAELLQRLGRHRDAARAWFRAGDMAKAVAQLELVGDHVAIARVYLAWGKGAEARAALGAVGPESSGYRDALELLAELELKDKRPQEAYRAYDKLVRWAVERQDIGDATRRWLVQMAEILFAHGKKTEALACLSRVSELGLSTPELDDKRRELEGLATPAVAAEAPKANEATRALRKLTTTLGVPRHDRYEFVGKIGQGGNGVIYKAHDRMLGRQLVIKMILQTAVADDLAKKFFLREAQTAAQLNHPNIVTIYDMGEMSGQPFIAMELVDGQNLADIVEVDGALPVSPRDLLHITGQLCAAMQYAHDKGFVHRDIKLENVMLTTAGRDVKLMDFGLAKAFTASDKTMVISGTPVYMSPEQIMGVGIDHRTDIYALGVMLFLLETGHFPFEDGNIFYHQQETPPPDPRQYNPTLPPGFKDVIDRCMAKKKEDRFSGAMEIHRALEKAFGRA